MRRLAEYIEDTTPVVVRYDPPEHVKRTPSERKAFYGGCGKSSIRTLVKQKRCKTWSKK